MVVGGLYFIGLKNQGEPVSIKGFPVPASLTVRHLLKQNPIKKLTAKNFLIFQQITTQLCRSCRAVFHWLMFRQKLFDPGFLT